MIIFVFLFIAAMIPLALAALGVVKTPAGRKAALAVNIASVFLVCALCFTVGAVGVSADSSDDVVVTSNEAVPASSGMTTGSGVGMLGAALATGLSCIGAGIAVSASASAAIGAISENPKTFGKALIFVALAEGVALYGMLISIQILAKF